VNAWLFGYGASVVVALVVILRMDRGLKSSPVLLVTFAVLWPIVVFEWLKANAEDERRKAGRK